jgi:hypothetical protein
MRGCATNFAVFFSLLRLCSYGFIHRNLLFAVNICYIFLQNKANAERLQDEEQNVYPKDTKNAFYFIRIILTQHNKKIK